MNDAFEETKALDWRDYWGAMVRRRWAVLGPLFVIGLGGFLVAHLWPRLYRSEALVLVEEQKVPAQFVKPNVNSDLQDRLEGMTQQILSRTKLQQIVEQYNLYPKERAHMIIDDVVDKMRAHIHIDPVKAPGREQLTAFTISFAADNARVAQEITNQLTSLFIEENLQDRTAASEGTTDFLASQLEAARKDLQQKEQKEREYKMQYLGELPEQEQSNLQILSSLEAQLRTASDALARAEQQKIYLESMRAEYKSTQKGQSQAGPVAGAHAGPEETADAAIRNLKEQLTQLEAKYTPDHPDVRHAKEELTKWEALKKKMAAEAEPATPQQTAAAVATAASSTGGQPALIEIDGRLKALNAEMQDYNKQMRELRDRIQGLQGRLSLTPIREQQLAEVSRGYANARDYYQSLLSKKLESELATNLERRQQGEQFRVVDPASLPQKPNEPNQIAIVIGGWILGLAAGFGVVLFLEITRRRLGTERDVSNTTHLPVLVRIPILRSPREEAYRKWRQIVEGAGVTLLLALAVFTGLYTYLSS